MVTGNGFPLGEYEEFGPFGYHGYDVGNRAVGILAGLLEASPESPASDNRLGVWSKDDFGVFENLCVFETGIRFVEPHEDVDGEEIAELHRTFGRFHTALPLSEAERHFLFDPLDVVDRSQRAWDVHRPESLVGVAEEVTSGGIKQVIQGREVVRRLAAWRREADEFADQGTLDEARQALGEIATTLVTDANWPREHEDLRVQLRESVQS